MKHLQCKEEQGVLKVMIWASLRVWDYTRRQKDLSKQSPQKICGLFSKVFGTTSLPSSFKTVKLRRIQLVRFLSRDVMDLMEKRRISRIERQNEQLDNSCSKKTEFRNLGDTCSSPFVSSSMESLGVLLITANIGSVCDEPEEIEKSWLQEFYKTVQDYQSGFIALHLQEFGGKNYQENMGCAENFIRRLMQSEEMSQYNCIQSFIDKDFTRTESFTAGHFSLSDSSGE
ncbi:unnamed protein product [Ranitomeya imitator]|uniref:Uncharacterized protein n=1 Tax=Ranitomeya imitator TaxID=111125 RepID=A0ABN9L457_9NEOB|nr:unnamed protein product [Ranitomeya imitator]